MELPAADHYQPFASLGVALAVGILMGLERERSQSGEDRNRSLFVGGARTLPMYSLAGALSSLAGSATGMWLVGVTFAVLSVPLILAYADDVKKERDRGLTSESAFVLAFLLGALATAEGVLEPTSRRLTVVVAVAVVATALLSLKHPLHRLAARVSEEDMYATVKFLILAAVILPLLPDQRYGPYGALNPFHIGLMIVLIAGMSFLGYIAIRILGPGRGLGLTGILGGLASSTAVTLSFAARARQAPAFFKAFALGIILASMVMFIRVLVLAAITHRPLVPVLAIPVGAMCFVAVAASAIYYRLERQGRPEAAEVAIHNPFEIGSAVKFGLLFAAVSVLVKAAVQYLGQTGLYLAAFLAGLTDVDAITLSTSRLAREGTALSIAATAIVIGCLTNTLVKGGMSTSLGGWRFGKWVWIPFAIQLAAGAAGVAAIWLTGLGDAAGDPSPGG